MLRLGSFFLVNHVCSGFDGVMEVIKAMSRRSYYLGIETLNQHASVYTAVMWRPSD